MAAAADPRGGPWRRLEAWRARSISNRITAAALALTLTVALVIGGATFVAMRVLIRRNIAAALESQARLAEQKLVSDLDLAARDLADLAENSFIANGLVDSLGRDTYLLPFLREHRPPIAARAVLVLCDFQGKPIAFNDPSRRGLGGVRGVKAVLTGARPYVETVEGDGGAQLVLSYPVIFPPTGQVEGVIVERLDLSELLAGATGFLGRDYQARLVVNGLSVGGAASAEPGLAVAVRVPILPQPLAGLTVALEVGTRAEVFAPLRWVAIVYLVTGLATVLVVFRRSRAMARRLAGPIEALSRTASRIAAGGELEMAGAVGGADEVGALSVAIDAMIGKLRVSHEQLEQRVRERTAELQVREKELERYAETQAVLLREVNHRVKNNLAAIIGVVHLEENRPGGTDPSIRKLLSEMESRIRSLATVHALLSGVEWRPLPLGDLCQRLLRSVLVEAKGTAPELHVDPSPVRVESGQAHNLALVLNELATNTLKYGRSAAGRFQVVVGIESAEREVVLTYRDHGPGFPPPVLAFAPEAMGTGLQLLKGIVETSLGGALALSNDDGAVVSIRFTCAPPREIGAPA